MSSTESHGHTFKFDHVLGENTTQEQVFERVGGQVIASCLSGINATVFAYGQTGSGKTHTMHGDASDDAAAGLTPRILQHLFARVAGLEKQSPTTKISVR